MPYHNSKKNDSTTKKYASKAGKTKPKTFGSGLVKKTESAIQKRRRLLQSI